jgi:hypothetical protein
MLDLQREAFVHSHDGFSWSERGRRGKHATDLALVLDHYALAVGNGKPR